MKVTDRLREIYEETAAKYDAVVTKARIPHFLTLIRMMNLRGDEHVVDFGCGPGNLTREIFPYVMKCTGIDASPAMIERAKQSLPFIEWRVGDATQTEVPDGQFDAAVSSQLIPWLPNPHAFFQEVHRVLKPGGALGLITSSSSSYREFFQAFEKLLRTYEEYFRTDDVSEVFGSKSYTVSNLQTMLAAAGFRVENWTIVTVEIPATVDSYLDLIRMFTGDHYLSPLPASMRAEAMARLRQYLHREGLTLNEKSTVLVARRV